MFKLTKKKDMYISTAPEAKPLLIIFESHTDTASTKLVLENLCMLKTMHYNTFFNEGPQDCDFDTLLNQYKTVSTKEDYFSGIEQMIKEGKLASDSWAASESAAEAQLLYGRLLESLKGNDFKFFSVDVPTNIRMDIANSELEHDFRGTNMRSHSMAKNIKKALISPSVTGGIYIVGARHFGVVSFLKEQGQKNIKTIAAISHDIDQPSNNQMNSIHVLMKSNGRNSDIKELGIDPLTHCVIDIRSRNYNDKFLEVYGKESTEKAFEAKPLIEHTEDKTHDRNVHKVYENIGSVSLVGAELIESAPLIKYLAKEIVCPLLSFDTTSIPNYTNIFPENNIFWVTAHFSFTSLGYFFFTLSNPELSNTYSYISPIASTVGYAVRLNLNDQYNELAKARLSALSEDSKDDMSCFEEVTFSSAIAFAFSSIQQFGFKHSAYTAFTVGSMSYANCIASNEKFTNPDSSFLGKVIPYVVDAAVLVSLVKNINFGNLDSFSSVAITAKKSSSILAALMFADIMTKSVVEIIPNDFLEFVDSIPETISCLVGLGECKEEANS